MGKSTHFFGQPVYGQLIKSLDRAIIVEMSRKNGGEKYVKSFVLSIALSITLSITLSNILSNILSATNG